MIDKKAKFAVVMYRPYAVRKTLDIFRDKWSFEVLQELFHGVRRFDQFQENLKISRSVLTRRLKHLAAKSIISREVYQERPRRFEYRLTARGVDMYAIFLMLRQWGERWLEAGKRDVPALVHTACGRDLVPLLICSHCNWLALEQAPIEQCNFLVLHEIHLIVQFGSGCSS